MGEIFFSISFLEWSLMRCFFLPKICIFAVIFGQNYILFLLTSLDSRDDPLVISKLHHWNWFFGIDCAVGQPYRNILEGKFVVGGLFWGWGCGFGDVGGAGGCHCNGPNGDLSSNKRLCLYNVHWLLECVGIYRGPFSVNVVAGRSWVFLDNIRAQCPQCICCGIN